MPSQRLRPPPELNATETEVFLSIVGSLDAGHFRPSDTPLLASYATSVVTEREAVAHLKSEGHVVNGRANAWLIVKEKAHREMIALSLRLRLSPQGRGRPLVRKDRISAYEKLMLADQASDDDGDEAGQD
jgi:phage terminase small subunit